MKYFYIVTLKSQPSVYTHPQDSGVLVFFFELWLKQKDFNCYVFEHGESNPIIPPAVNHPFKVERVCTITMSNFWCTCQVRYCGCVSFPSKKNTLNITLLVEPQTRTRPPNWRHTFWIQPTHLLDIQVYYYSLSRSQVEKGISCNTVIQTGNEPRSPSCIQSVVASWK